MSAEPDWIFQTTIPNGDAETKRNWLRARSDEVKAAGSKWARASWRDENPDVMLLEAWRERPDDEGDPRFDHPNRRTSLEKEAVEAFIGRKLDE